MPRQSWQLRWFKVRNISKTRTNSDLAQMSKLTRLCFQNAQQFISRILLQFLFNVTVVAILNFILLNNKCDSLAVQCERSDKGSIAQYIHVCSDTLRPLFHRMSKIKCGKTQTVSPMLCSIYPKCLGYPI